MPKSGGVRPAQGVGQRVDRVCIRRRDGGTDVLARCRVLGDAARGAGSLGEDRRGVGLVHIRDVDGHVDAVRAAVAVGDRNRHRIAGFRLEVERGAGLELAAGPDDAEVGGIRPAQGVGQCVARVRIRRRDGGTDVLARCRVLGDAPRGAGSLGEDRPTPSVTESSAHYAKLARCGQGIPCVAQVWRFAFPEGHSNACRFRIPRESEG